MLSKLEELALSGFSSSAIEAALNSIEFSLRENNTGSFPRGLSLMLRAVGAWIYERDPLQPIQVTGHHVLCGSWIREAALGYAWTHACCCVLHSTVPGRVEGGGQPVLSFEQYIFLLQVFLSFLRLRLGAWVFEFCVFVAGWRHALKSEWPSITVLLLLLLLQACYGLLRPDSWTSAMKKTPLHPPLPSIPLFISPPASLTCPSCHPGPCPPCPPSHVPIIPLLPPPPLSGRTL